MRNQAPDTRYHRTHVTANSSETPKVYLKSSQLRASPGPWATVNPAVTPRPATQSHSLYRPRNVWQSMHSLFLAVIRCWRAAKAIPGLQAGVITYVHAGRVLPGCTLPPAAIHSSSHALGPPSEAPAAVIPTPPTHGQHCICS
jgi:hypothetical protein